MNSVKNELCTRVYAQGAKFMDGVILRYRTRARARCTRSRQRFFFPEKKGKFEPSERTIADKRTERTTESAVVQSILQHQANTTSNISMTINRKHI